ncbi:WAP, Kazal, immunoglobulin, Kunitz and NTR domain-containing protein 2 [Exaiptasia diaphana]|uniref:Papilin n=1 Tax=Exaiptasia diaphana TaxID=2652724 RepID=A0A913XRL1_EXADI|nr:WAP, Kazal, immunoglobulin, Kunitz and NTR domain-containing protein 2 [Exaiptasia diaphana]
MHITVKFTGSCDLQNRYLFISPLHKNTAILELNQPGKIQCLFLGDPISITWTKLEMDSLPPRMIPIKDTLVIPQVRVADEGTYRCEAYNGLSIVEAFVKITVDYDTENMNLDYSKRPKASCLLPLRYGYCTQHDVRWYFDAATRTCQPFVYSGCGRNENNFKTEKQCKSACGHWAGDICQLPKKRGPCKAYIPRWHYDKDKAQCTRFIYGGCRGNANRFSSKLSCEAKCRAQKGYLSPCIKLYMNAVNSHRKGLFRPRCTSRGEFQKTQCHASVCFCMDENGVEMQGTRVPNGQYINCTSKGFAIQFGGISTTPIERLSRK